MSQLPPQASRPWWDLPGRIAAWVVPLIVYALVVIPLAIDKREMLNSDAVSYIIRAQRLAAGDLWGSVDGYWSPLISWSIAPLLKLGADGLYAARGVLCAWGGAFVLVFGWFLASFAGLNWVWRLLACTTMALAVAPVAVRQITPDIIMATCLFAYFTAITDARLFDSRRRQVVAGLLGGLSYLAKAYALPVVAVHLPLTIFVRWLTDRRCRISDPRSEIQNPKSKISSLLFCLVGLGALALPWIATLSLKYDRLTISQSASRAHAAAMLGHNAVAAVARDTEAAQTVDAGWASNRQLQVIGEHLKKLWTYLRQFDSIPIPRTGIAIHFSIFISVALLLAITGLLPLQVDRWRLIWLLGTMLLYVGPLLLVWLIFRYVVSILPPLLIGAGLMLILRWRPPRSTGRPLTLFRISQWGLALLMLLSFARVGISEIQALSNSKKGTPLYRILATKLTRAKLTGNICSTDRIVGAYVALHAKVGIVRFPPDADPAAAEAALRQQNAGSLIIWRTPARLRQDEAATRAATRIAATTTAPAGPPDADDSDADDDDAPAARKPRRAADVALQIVRRPGWRLAFVHKGQFGQGEVHVPPWRKWSPPATKPSRK